jgi:glycosyltransferase involved in cell wall biosynthesis
MAVCVVFHKAPQAYCGEVTMKINFILPGLFFSGGVRVVLKYCESLNAAGHDCKVWYPFEKFRFKRGGKYVHCYLTPSMIPDADVVIATSWETANIVNGLPQRCGKKFYLIQHYEQWDYHNGGLKREDVEDTYFYPMRHIIVSHNLRYMLPVQHYDDAVVRWGRDLPEDYVKEYGEPRILFNMRSEIWKGYQSLVTVLNRIRKEYPDIEIKNYGVPHVSDEKLDALFRWANIFVNASWVEGFGEPPLEAAGYGCAVIAPENSAMPEMFTANLDMIFCKAKDEECLYRSLVYLIGRPERRELMGQNARAKSARYTYDRAFHEFEKVITE